MITKRNAIGILIGVELVLNSANVNFVAFDRYASHGQLDGQMTAPCVIVLAAAEAPLAGGVVSVQSPWTSTDAASLRCTHARQPANQPPAAIDGQGLPGDVGAAA